MGVLARPPVASTKVASTIPSAVASRVPPAVTAIAPVLLAVVALLLLCPRRLGGGCRRRGRRLRSAEQAAEKPAEEAAARGRARERLRLGSRYGRGSCGHGRGGGRGGEAFLDHPRRVRGGGARDYPVVAARVRLRPPAAP